MNEEIGELKKELKELSMNWAGNLGVADFLDYSNRKIDSWASKYAVFSKDKLGELAEKSIDEMNKEEREKLLDAFCEVDYSELKHKYIVVRKKDLEEEINHINEHLVYLQGVENPLEHAAPDEEVLQYFKEFIADKGLDAEIALLGFDNILWKTFLERLRDGKLFTGEGGSKRLLGQNSKEVKESGSA